MRVKATNENGEAVLNKALKKFQHAGRNLLRGGGDGDSGSHRRRVRGSESNNANNSDIKRGLMSQMTYGDPKTGCSYYPYDYDCNHYRD